ncbi:MAG: radical SAM protein, partial [Leptospiraceae bacterium]|nr:radical SAM protein [Leptospiraceae bacterium]
MPFEEITDRSKRTFKKLRLSLGNACNFSCIYCVSPDSKSQMMQSGLSVKEYIQIVKSLHSILQLEEVRLTGGEPCLYPELGELLCGLRDLGIPKLTLTSNGSLIEKFIPSFLNCKLSSVNISLDGTDPVIFQRMSQRNSAKKTLSAIDSLIQAGIPTRLNATLVKGFNHEETIPLLEFAGKRNIVIRYIELMNMGHLKEKGGKFIFSEKEILETIQSKYSIIELPRNPSSTARYWQTTDTDYIFGIIANESSPFCADCNRLRLDSRG